MQRGEGLAVEVTPSGFSTNINSVVLKLNGVTLSSKSAAPYIWSHEDFGDLDQLDPGAYRLEALASDLSGDEANKSLEFDIFQQPELSLAAYRLNQPDFSAPTPVTYAENSVTNRIPPAVIETPFQGNGHSTSWDGRVYVVTNTGGWYIRALRPQNITKNANGTPDFDTAFSNRICFEHDGDSANCPSELNGNYDHNWVALVRNTDHAENPFPSDNAGNRNVNGDYLTYEAHMYHTRVPAGGGKAVGFRSTRITLSQPYSSNAQIDSFEIRNDWQDLRNTNNDFIDCIEPSLTIDGQLLLCNGDRTGHGGINDIAYSWTSTAASTTGWRPLISLANLYNDRNQLIDGKKLGERFPLAQQPIRDMDGTILDGTDEINGAYPWISRDGSEVFFQSMRAVDNANRAGTMAIGRWTGWSTRLLDSPINPDRLGTGKRRLFMSSPGAFTTMWSPFPDVENMPIPYSAKGPVFPIFGSNTRDYSEIEFDDYLDGNYWVTLDMNEKISRNWQFVTNETPDTSGLFNNATLINAQFPLEYNAVDGNVGKLGQAIYFSKGSYLTIPYQASLTRLNNGFTVEFFVKAGNGATAAADAEGLFATIGNSLSLIIDSAGRVTARFAPLVGGTSTVTGPSLLASTETNWQHIALTYDKISGEAIFYRDGEEFSKTTLADLDWEITSDAVTIGPQGARNNLLMLLDEFKISNIARTPTEVAYAGYKSKSAPTLNANLSAQIPSHLQSLTQAITMETDFWSSEVASLGSDLFFDTILSKNQTASCASCHVEALDFTDGLAIAESDESTTPLTRNTPTIFNRIFSSKQGWGGGNESLLAQSTGPIQHVHEMNLPMGDAIQRLRDDNNYLQKFDDAFGSLPTEELLGDALVAFQLSSFSAANLDDQDRLNAEQELGKRMFTGKARCSGCHSGPNFADESFRNNGVTPNSADDGRMLVSGRERDEGLFKVPTLRGIVNTAPYMHNGSIATLSQVVNEYISASTEDRANKDTDILPIELSNAEKNALIEYLKVL
jgi:cytochrome c peroxidase